MMRAARITMWLALAWGFVMVGIRLAGLDRFGLALLAGFVAGACITRVNDAFDDRPRS